MAAAILQLITSFYAKYSENIFFGDTNENYNVRKDYCTAHQDEAVISTKVHLSQNTDSRQ